MSKSNHLILKKLVFNDFHLKVALWDKIQKSLFQEEVLSPMKNSESQQDFEEYTY